VVHDRLVLPAALFRGLTEKRWRERPSTIYHLYQTEFGITVVRAHERLRAVGADRNTARVLGVAPGQPMLQVRRVALGLGGQPVEWRISTVATAQHDYVNLLSRPSLQLGRHFGGKKRIGMCQLRVSPLESGRPEEVQGHEAPTGLEATLDARGHDLKLLDVVQ
jgi:hypothetical protein